MSGNIFSSLRENGQQHILDFFEELELKEQKTFLEQLEDTDWDEMKGLIRENVVTKPEIKIPSDLKPAPYFPALPSDDKMGMLYVEADKKGREMIKTGKVALITVAGGQGTRLGFDGPKGTYNITPVKEKSFFQYFAEKITRAREKYAADLQWLIMTSSANDDETRNFFAQNAFLGLPCESVHFFRQGNMPAVSFDGKVLIQNKSSLALSPNGHGGLFAALKKNGLLDMLTVKGIEALSYFQIDNLIVPPLDALFIGLHFLEKSDMSSKMLPKTGPFEKLGNFCVSEGKLNIIEYSDLPDELAEKRNSDGKLVFISGSPAIHIISTKFISKLTQKGGNLKLPWHRAEKKVQFIDKSGNLVKPEKANAVKLEMFIFDALPLADKTMILEANREEEFSPVKNPDGIDSVVSCKAMFIEKEARQLERAGIKVPRKPDGTANCVIELSPLKYFDTEDVINNVRDIIPPKPEEKVYYA